MSLENSPKLHDRDQVKSSLPNFLNKIGSEFGLSEIDSSQPLTAFIADISLRDSLSNIELEPQHNVHKPNLRIIIDDLVRISSLNDDNFQQVHQDLKQFNQLIRKQAQRPEQLSALDDLRALLDNDSRTRYKSDNERVLQEEAEERQTYWSDIDKKRALEFKKFLEDQKKSFAEMQLKDLAKKELDETNKAFYKGLSDHIANEIIGAEMELNSLQHYQLTLKFMLLVFDKGSMAFMSTMGAIDGLNLTLPSFANNLSNLQKYHSNAVGMMNKHST